MRWSRGIVGFRGIEEGEGRRRVFKGPRGKGVGGVYVQVVG